VLLANGYYLTIYPLGLTGRMIPGLHAKLRNFAQPKRGNLGDIALQLFAHWQYWSHATR
jgi:hypothetical protein